MAGLGKRRADFVPEGEPRNFLDRFSKADLAELVWDFATMAHGEEAETNANPGIVMDIIEEHAAAVFGNTGRVYRSKRKEAAK